MLKHMSRYHTFEDHSIIKSVFFTIHCRFAVLGRNGYWITWLHKLASYSFRFKS
jgi:hypothetical protein